MKKIFFLTLFFLLVPFKTQAFSLSPTKIDLTIDAGEKQILEIKIKNTEAGPVGLRPVVMGVEQNTSGATIFVSGKSEIESWAVTKNTNFVLQPGQEQMVQFLIDVPDGSYPGSYYLGLGVGQDSVSESNVNLSGRLLAVVNIKVSGTANEELVLNNWKSTKMFWFSPEWKFGAEVENKGNVELPLKGSVVVYSLFGKKLIEKDLPMGNKIIPGTKRFFVWDASLSKVDIFKPGIFRANLTLQYGLTGQKITTSTTFWYFYPPTLFVIVAIPMLVVLIFLAKKIFSH